MANRGKRDLGGIEELGAQIIRNCADEHGVGGTGDKIADVFKSRERRHGVTIGFFGFVGGIVLIFAFREFRLVGACPGVPAADDGGVCEDWAGFVRLARGGGGLGSFGHAGFSLGDWVPATFHYCARLEGNYLQGLAVQAEAFGAGKERGRFAGLR